jgi:capsular polysaccharide transport system permease protein
MYVSQASFAVRSAGSNAPAVAGIAAAMLSSGGGSGTDPFIINDYIQSLDIVQDIDKELNLVKHYTARSHDIISRLWQKPTQDELLKYWRRVMVPQLSMETGIISVEARAYTPEMAQKITQAVLARSEALVNAMNERSRNDAVELARKEIERAEERVKASQMALKEFRNLHAMLDPKVTAGGLQDIVTKLEAESTALRTKIAETSSYMRDSTPVLKSLRQRLNAVESQLAREKQRVAGTSAAESNLNSLVAGYEELSMEAEFAKQQLVAAMSALEKARIEQATQSRYVVAYQQPTLPDESLYPRPLLFTLYTFLGSLIVLGLLSLIWASIREHAGF